MDPILGAMLQLGGTGVLAAVLYKLLVDDRKASNEKHEKMLNTFKDEQTAERKRSDDLLKTEQTRSDNRDSRTLLLFETFREKFTCKYPGHEHNRPPVGEVK